MINHISLVKALKKFGHPPVEWLPKDYWPTDMGGGGRTLHDDWAIPFLRSIPRLDTAYAIPLPFRKIEGNGQPVLMPVVNDDYPIIEGTPIIMRDAWDPVKGVTRSVRHVETMMSVHPLDPKGPRTVWSRQEAFINGIWTECFYTRSVNIFGSKWLWYDGLKLDADGPMCWYPEASASIKWHWLG